MSVYSGSSPFAGGKLGGARGMGAKVSRGGAKKEAAKRNSLREVNKIQRTGTAASSTVKGTVTYTTGIGTSGQGLIKSANTLSLTSTGGLGTYDALGIVAGGGSPMGFITVTSGTDFTNAAGAFSDKKNVKVTFFQRDAGTFHGILDEDSFFRNSYKVFFPEIKSLNVISDNIGQPNSLTIKFTTG